MTEDDEFGHYLAGLTDGEGSFCIYDRSTSKLDTRRFNGYYITFSLKLRVDDIDILREIKEFLKCGNIYFLKRDERSYNTHPTASFMVSNTTQLHKVIVPFFEKYPLRAKKRLDFINWKKAVRIMAAYRLPGVDKYGRSIKWRKLIAGSKDDIRLKQLCNYIKMNRICEPTNSKEI